MNRLLPWLLCLMVLTVCVTSQRSVRRRLSADNEEMDIGVNRLRTPGNKETLSTHNMILNENLNQHMINQHKPYVKDENYARRKTSLRGPQIIDNDDSDLDFSLKEKANKEGDSINTIGDVQNDKSTLNDDILPLKDTQNAKTNHKNISFITYLFIYICLISSVAVLIFCKFTFASDIYDTVGGNDKLKQIGLLDTNDRLDESKQIPFSSIINSFVNHHRQLNEMNVDEIDENMFSSDASSR